MAILNNTIAIRLIGVCPHNSSSLFGVRGYFRSLWCSMAYPHRKVLLGRKASQISLCTPNVTSGFEVKALIPQVSATTPSVHSFLTDSAGGFVSVYVHIFTRERFVHFHIIIQDIWWTFYTFFAHYL